MLIYLYVLQRAPQQRNINSPGNRHSPFPSDSFPPPTSPNSAFNQTHQYLRGVQRANNTPTATTHLPGKQSLDPQILLVCKSRSFSL